MICLVAGAVVATLMSNAITLRWVHSVEKIPWEEDWRLGPHGLEITEARVHGSGAGMDPPAEARLVHGAWAWRPRVPPQQEVVLRRSGATADWQICHADRCRPMSDFVPPEADPVVMKACDGP